MAKRIVSCCDDNVLLIFRNADLAGLSEEKV